MSELPTDQKDQKEKRKNKHKNKKEKEEKKSTKKSRKISDEDKSSKKKKKSSKNEIASNCEDTKSKDKPKSELKNGKTKKDKKLKEKKRESEKSTIDPSSSLPSPELDLPKSPKLNEDSKKKKSQKDKEVSVSVDQKLKGKKRKAENTVETTSSPETDLSKAKKQRIAESHESGTDLDEESDPKPLSICAQKDILDQVLSGESISGEKVVNDRDHIKKNKKGDKALDQILESTEPLPTTIKGWFEKLNSQVEKKMLSRCGRFVALDCEMVGVGPDGIESMLARVSIVNYYGEMLLDAYVTPLEKVVDYRTHVSGITPHLLRTKGQPFQQVQKVVSAILKDKIVIGHGLKNDFHCLLLSHPARDIRDSSLYKPFREKYGKGKAPKLKKLGLEILQVVFQENEHCSVEDARMCMLLYRRFRRDWESSIYLKGGSTPGRVKGRVAEMKQRQFKGKFRHSK